VFLALAGPNYAVPRSEWPRKVFLAPDIDLREVVVTEKYRLKAIEWLTAFVQVSFAQEMPVQYTGFRERTADFRALISKWIASLERSEITPELIGLAKKLEPNLRLKEKVIEWIREVDAANVDEVIGAGVGYLASCAESLQWWEAAGVVGKFLLAPGVTQTAALGSIEIVRGFVEKGDGAQIGLFVKAIIQIVSAAWNTGVSARGDRLLGAACVEAIAAIPKNPPVPVALFEDSFLYLWGHGSDRPDTNAACFEIWTRDVPNIANEAFLARIVEIRELADVPDRTQEAETPAAAEGEPVQTPDGPQTDDDTLPQPEVGAELDESQRPAQVSTESPATGEPPVDDGPAVPEVEPRLDEDQPSVQGPTGDSSVEDGGSAG
jgi:hypothetical protein